MNLAAVAQQEMNIVKPRIVLCGVDFFGDGYCYDDHGVQPGVWSQRENMQRLIDYLWDKGWEIYTISETTLDVPKLCE